MAAAVDFKAYLNGSSEPLNAETVHACDIDLDIGMPDMCALTLNNVDNPAADNKKYSESVNPGDAIEIKISDKRVFIGEVVGIEPHFSSKGESHCVLRCFNKLHRLTRGRKSKTYEKQTDADIVTKIAQEHSLSTDKIEKTDIKHDHVYQHNQTDLEFILQRAARINFEVRVEDTKLLFGKRNPAVDSGVVFDWSSGGGGEDKPDLQKFMPRLSSAGMVQEVNVRSWNPDKHEEIVGKATSLDKKLGDKDGPTQAQPFGKKVLYYDVDIPVGSKEEAEAIAKAKLEELSLGYITGEGVAKGNPDLMPGKTVTVQNLDGRFDGQYYLVAVKHRYKHEGESGEAGFRTHIRVQRNAEGGGSQNQQGGTA